MSSLDLAVSARGRADPVKTALPNPQKTRKAHFACLYPGCPHSGSARLGLFRTPTQLLKHCLKCHPDKDFLFSIMKELTRDTHGKTYSPVAMPSAEALNGRDANSLDLTSHDLELLLPVIQSLTELPGMEGCFKCCAYCLIIHLGVCTPHLCNQSAVVIPPTSESRQPVTLPRVPVFIISSALSDPFGWKYHKDVEHKDVAAYYNGAAGKGSHYLDLFTRFVGAGKSSKQPQYIKHGSASNLVDFAKTKPILKLLMEQSPRVTFPFQVRFNSIKADQPAQAIGVTAVAGPIYSSFLSAPRLTDPVEQGKVIADKEPILQLHRHSKTSEPSKEPSCNHDLMFVPPALEKDPSSPLNFTAVLDVLNKLRSLFEGTDWCKKARDIFEKTKAMVFTQMGDWFMGHIQPNLSQLNASLDDLKCRVVLSFYESDSFKSAVELRDNNLVTSEEREQLRVLKDLADKLRECADRGDMVIKEKQDIATEATKFMTSGHLEVSGLLQSMSNLFAGEEYTPVLTAPFSLPQKIGARESMAKVTADAAGYIGAPCITLQRASRKETEVTEGAKFLSGQFKSWLCRESAGSSFLANLEEIPVTDFKDALLCVLRDYETAARPMQGFNTATHSEKQMGNISGQTCPYTPTVIGEGINVLSVTPTTDDQVIGHGCMTAVMISQGEDVLHENLKESLSMDSAALKRPLEARRPCLPAIDLYPPRSASKASPAPSLIREEGAHADYDGLHSVYQGSPAHKKRSHGGLTSIETANSDLGLVTLKSEEVVEAVVPPQLAANDGGQDIIEQKGLVNIDKSLFKISKCSDEDMRMIRAKDFISRHIADKLTK